MDQPSTEDTEQYEAGKGLGLTEMRRHSHQARENEREGKQGECGSDESEFFSYDRENEISVLLGKKVESLLSTGGEALPSELAAANRQLGLDNLIPGATWIYLGIEIHQNAVLLVRGKRVP